MFVTPPAVAGAGTASTAPAFTALGRCLEQNHRLLLAFVMDESGSLGDASRSQPGTDPTAQRVTAAQVAVQGLADLAGRGVQVKVLLSGFSDDLHTYGPWQTLDQTSTGAIAGQLASFRTRDQGLDTDFYDAIAGVQRALSAEAATTHNAACQVVLLFTDGRFDIATTGSKAYDTNGADPDATKVAKGIAALCAPNGPMQKLRRANGETITLALADPSAPNADQPDRAFLSPRLGRLWVAGRAVRRFVRRRELLGPRRPVRRDRQQHPGRDPAARWLCGQCARLRHRSRARQLPRPGRCRELTPGRGGHRAEPSTAARLALGRVEPDADRARRAGERDVAPLRLDRRRPGSGRRSRLLDLVGSLDGQLRGREPGRHVPSVPLQHLEARAP